MVLMHKPTEQTYTELQTAFDWFNQKLFKSELPSCLITLQRQKRTMGYYSRDRFVDSSGTKADEIAMNPEYFAIQTPHEVMSTLAHEMAHLWQDHFGKPGRGRYHNQEWASKMEEIGLIPSHTGQVGGSKTGDQMDHFIDRQGSFIHASEALLDSDFKISWYDRYPPITASMQPAGGIKLEGQGNDARQDQNVAPAAANAALASELSLKAVGLGGRWKYVCLNCDIQAWGKPKLNLICGDCDLALSGNGSD